MRVETDDEVYRVDSHWLGPPKATFPWRWRYVDYAIFGATWLLVLALARQLFEPSIWVFVWPAVIGAYVVKFAGRVVTPERPLGAVLAMFSLEAAGPRERTRGHRATVSTRHVRVQSQFPIPTARTLLKETKARVR